VVIEGEPHQLSMKGLLLKINNTGKRPVVYVVTGTAEELAEFVGSKGNDEQGNSYARYLQAPYTKDAKITAEPSPYPVHYEYDECGKKCDMYWQDVEIDGKLREDLSGFRCRMNDEQRLINKAIKKLVEEKMAKALDSNGGFNIGALTSSNEEGFTTENAELQQAPAAKPTTSKAGRGRRTLS